MQPEKEGRIIDISMPLTEGIPVWPSSERFKLIWLKSFGESGVNESTISLNSHTGTHVDAPFHFLQTGKTIGEMPLDRFCGEAYVVEYSGEDEINPVFLDKANIPDECKKLLFKTSNSILRQDRERFMEDYVSLGIEGARWVVDRGIELVGIDCLSIEKFSANMGDTHRLLLGKDIVVLEGLNLMEAKEGGYYLVALPLNIPQAEGAPVRAILIKDDA